MAEKRKLHQEIEKTLKKIDEGVVEFTCLCSKWSESTNAAQKDKCELEMKKELKKLQRLRDQLKTWQASTDVKDKASIDDARKKIERNMERFKTIERESKIKAFSKEGLAQKGKLDPHEQELAKHRKRFQTSIKAFQTQLDFFESEIEALSNKKSKARDEERLSELQQLCERHTWHIQKLDIVLRRLENEDLDLSSLESIQNAVEYYLEECQNPDVQFDEDLYTILDEVDAESFTKSSNSRDFTETERPRSELIALSKPNEQRPTLAKSICQKRATSLPEGETDNTSTIAPRQTSDQINQSADADAVTDNADAKARGFTEIKKHVFDKKKIFTNPLKESLVSAPLFKVKMVHTSREKVSDFKRHEPKETSDVFMNDEIVNVKVSDINVDTTFADESSEQLESLASSKSYSEPLPPILENAASSLEASYQYVVQPCDSRRKIFSVPSAFCESWCEHPLNFPRMPLEGSTTNGFFRKLNSEVLFWIFYNQPGVQQVMAARELKARHWRFYKPRSWWILFPPKPTNSGGQNAAQDPSSNETVGRNEFVYFDFDHTWQNQRNSDICLEDKYYEDEIPPSAIPSYSESSANTKLHHMTSMDMNKEIHLSNSDIHPMRSSHPALEGGNVFYPGAWNEAMTNPTEFIPSSLAAGSPDVPGSFRFGDHSYGMNVPRMSRPSIQQGGMPQNFNPTSKPRMRHYPAAQLQQRTVPLNFRQNIGNVPNQGQNNDLSAMLMDNRDHVFLPPNAYPQASHFSKQSVNTSAMPRIAGVMQSASRSRWKQ